MRNVRNQLAVDTAQHCCPDRFRDLDLLRHLVRRVARTRGKAMLLAARMCTVCAFSSRKQPSKITPYRFISYHAGVTCCFNLVDDCGGVEWGERPYFC